jgi:hypothetical protein
MIARAHEFLQRLTDYLARHPHVVAYAAAAVGALAIPLAIGLLIAGSIALAFVALLLGGVAATSAAVAWNGLTLSDELARQTAELDELRPRVDVLEAVTDLHSAQAALSAPLVDDLANVIEGKLPDRASPRLVFPRPAEAPAAPDKAEVPKPLRPAARTLAPAHVAEDFGVDEELPPDEEFNDEPAFRPTIRTATASREPGALRAAFSARVRSGDFRGALALGAEIVTAAPNSRMAADFLALRPYLEHRAADRPAPVKQAL